MTPAPTLSTGLTRASTKTWAENHCVIETEFNNATPRRSFTMTIGPEYGKKLVPRVIAFDFVVVSESDPASFSVNTVLSILCVLCSPPQIHFPPVHWIARPSSDWSNLKVRATAITVVSTLPKATKIMTCIPAPARCSLRMSLIARTGKTSFSLYHPLKSQMGSSLIPGLS